jgi:hypothetical protein
MHDRGELGRALERVVQDAPSRPTELRRAVAVRKVASTRHSAPARDTKQETSSGKASKA